MTADKPLLIVVGPTASGKSALALRLAAETHGEIISADSVQIYRHFDLGSGKPNAQELSRVRHHAIDSHEPLDTVDAAGWAQIAEDAIQDIRARGKLPIVCGGSFLWVRALMYGLAPAPPGSPELREEHAAFIEQKGRAALHERLREIDPAAHERLAPNDFVRVSRALEGFELSGKSISAWQKEHGFRTLKRPVRLIGIQHEPDHLSERIAQRIEDMFDHGWQAEVQSLLDRGLGESRAMGAVGYRQIAQHLGYEFAKRAGAAPEAGPADHHRGDRPLSEEELRAKIHRATRTFSKRQRTWLKDETIEWIRPADVDQFAL